jgi:hypothetical protein
MNIIKFNRAYSSIVVILLLCACTVLGEKEVTITEDYVVNPNWNKQSNSFDVVRMLPKDTVNYIDPEQTDYIELANSLVEDDTFSYSADVDYNGTDYSERKVYFNKDNDFLWWADLHDSNSTKKILGKLEKETWYLLGGLSSKGSLFYIYIDPSGKLHRFKKLASNY